METSLSGGVRSQEEQQRNDSRIDQSNAFISETTSCESLKTMDSSPNHIEDHIERSICSTRAKLITFIISALLLIAAGTSAGVIFTAIKSDSSSSSENIAQHLVIATSTEIPMSTIVTGSQSGSACSSSTYTSINDPSRNYNYIGSQGTCDNGHPFVTSNGGAWIRFEGSGGTKIPTWSVDIRHCGAYTAVWSNNTLPTVMNVLANITLCISTLLHTCGALMDASVIYCTGNYYVYFLSPLGFCTARYCTA